MSSPGLNILDSPIDTDDAMTSMLAHDAPRAAPLGVPVTADDLSELIQSFNQVSRQLQATQSALHAEVARLKSELADASAQLRRSRSLAALGEMAAGIAHEIRNPLGSIQLYAQALGEETCDSPSASSLCEKISRAVGHLDAVVRDVLSFARDRKLQPRVMAASDLIDRAIESSCALLAMHEIRIRVDHHESHALEADETLLIQALSNLIRNAVEAMVEAGSPQKTLTLATRKAVRRCPDRVSRVRLVFLVQDSGPGIPADVVDRMFNPFFTTRRTGTGLGLAIVHRIVDAHGGHVSVGAGDDGIGARIEICLPPGEPDRAVTASTSDWRTRADDHASAHSAGRKPTRVHSNTNTQGTAIADPTGSLMHEPDSCRR